MLLTGEDDYNKKIFGGEDERQAFSHHSSIDNLSKSSHMMVHDGIQIDLTRQPDELKFLAEALTS